MTTEVRLTETDIDAIRERAAAAHPGPWHRYLMPDGMGERVVDNDDRLYVAQEIRPENAVFIAAARTDVPALCDELTTAREHLRHLHAALAEQTRITDDLVHMPCLFSSYYDTATYLNGIMPEEGQEATE